MGYLQFRQTVKEFYMRDQMQEKIYVIRVILVMFAAALLAAVSGCAGGIRGHAEELVEVTEDKPGEAAEEEAKGNTDEEAGASGKGDSRPGHSEPGASAEGNLEAGDTKPDKEGTIYVHVCGEVASPGVYELPAGSRLYEAVAAAGGLLDSAAAEQLNQAAKAEDGQQVYVPSREEADRGFSGSPSGQGPAASGWADDGRISLNTASKEQLMTLNGIGEAKAASIIRYREEHGGFRKIEELMEVEGIKEGVFNKVKDQIKI